MKLALAILVFVGLKIKELFVDFPKWVWTKHRKELVGMLLIGLCIVLVPFIFFGIVSLIFFIAHKLFDVAKDTSAILGVFIPVGALVLAIPVTLITEEHKKIKKFFANNWKEAKRISGVKSKKKGKRK